MIISPGQNSDIEDKHTGCHFLNSSLRVHWSGFHDNQSGIAAFRVGIGRKPLTVDIIPYQKPKLASEEEFPLQKSYGLSRGDTIYATVEAINKAGLTTTVSSLPTRLISDNDADLINENVFQCINV